jgi:hypothetical protein
MGNPVDVLTPASTANVDQSTADSRALMQHFLAQQGQIAAVPGLTGPGYDQPATGGGAVAPAPTATQFLAAGGQAPPPPPAPVAPPATTPATPVAAAPTTPPPLPAPAPAATGGGGSWGAPRGAAAPAPATVATPVDGAPARAAPDGVPPGSVRTGGNNTTDVYTDKDGNWHAIDKATGKPVESWGNGQPAGTDPNEGYGITDFVSETLGGGDANKPAIKPLITGVSTTGGTSTTGALAAGGGGGPLAPGLDQTQSNQFRTGQLALAQSIGQALGAEQPGAVTLDEQRLLDARNRQLGLATTLTDAVNAGPSAVPLLNEAAQLEARGKQNATIDLIRAAAEGKAPSVAEMQGMRQMGTLQSNILGNAAAMGRGGNSALALRSAAMSAGKLGGDAIANAAMQRAAETAGARGQLAGAIEAQRATDVGVASQNQGAELQSRGLDTQRMTAAAGQAANILGNVGATDLNAARANQDAAVTNRAQNIQETTAARGQLADTLNAGRGTDVNIAAQNQDSQITTRGQNIQQTQNQAGNVLQANQNQATAAGAQFNADVASKQQQGNMLATAAGIAGLSDERVKDDIAPAPSGMFREFLAAIEPSSFRYKGSQKPEVGVMAQDVEKSRVGKTLVRETPAGKAIDIPRTATAMLAALSDVNRRVSRLEGGA